MGAQPKRKISKRRTGKRRQAIKVKALQTVKSQESESKRIAKNLAKTNV